MPTGGLNPSAFTAAWDGAPDSQNRSTVTIKVHSNDPSLLFVVAWSETISDNDPNDHCGSATAAPPTTIEVDQDCVAAHGGEHDAWTAVITYRSLGSTSDSSATVKITGTPPTYRPPYHLATAAAGSPSPPADSPPSAQPAAPAGHELNFTRPTLSPK